MYRGMDKYVTQATREKIRLIKIKNVCSSKNIVKKIKGNPQNERNQPTEDLRPAYTYKILL